MICDYGCGQKARFQLKNGKWCCCKHYSSCPENKRKNREANSGENSTMYGKKFSTDHKKKLSQTKKKYYKNNNGYWTGKKRDAKTIEAIRQSNKRSYIERFGREKAELIKENHRKKTTGQKRTAAQKKRMSDGTRANKKYMKELKFEMQNGKAAWLNSFIKNPSKPQIKLYKMILELCPYAILNYPCLNYSIDIAIPFLNIAIEYDGSYWHLDKESDKIRQTKLENEGWIFTRFKDYIPSKKELKNILTKEIKFGN